MVPLLQQLNPQAAIDQLWPGLPVGEFQAWLEWVSEQPNYYTAKVGEAVCITKVFNQEDPPWLRAAQEVIWYGHGRDAVRALHRGMDWARLQGAVIYGYSLGTNLYVHKWRKL